MKWSELQSSEGPLDILGAGSSSVCLLNAGTTYILDKNFPNSLITGTKKRDDSYQQVF